MLFSFSFSSDILLEFSLVTHAKAEALVYNESPASCLQALPGAHAKARIFKRYTTRSEKESRRMVWRIISLLEIWSHCVTSDKTRGKGAKWGMGMVGPFKMIAIDGKSVIISNKAKIKKTVNIDQLAPFNKTQPRIPHKWPHMDVPYVDQKQAGPSYGVNDGSADWPSESAELSEDDWSVNPVQEFSGNDWSAGLSHASHQHLGSVDPVHKGSPHEQDAQAAGPIHQPPHEQDAQSAGQLHQPKHERDAQAIWP